MLLVIDAFKATSPLLSIFTLSLACHSLSSLFNRRLFSFFPFFHTLISCSRRLNHMASRFPRSFHSLSKPTQFILTSHKLSPTSPTLFGINKLQSQISTRTMAEHASTYRANGDNGDDGSTEGEHNQWKFRAPYKVHDNDPNFHARYQASCHCGKIRYQLSREKPLDSKYCHCTTCQKLHGTEQPFSMLVKKAYAHFAF